MAFTVINLFNQIGIIWFSNILRIAVVIFKFPLLIHYVGDDINNYYIIFGIIPLLAMFEFGLTATFLRHGGRSIRKYGTKSKNIIFQYYFSFSKIWFFISAFIGILILILYSYFFKVSVIHEFKVTVFFVALIYFLSIPFMHLSTILNCSGNTGFSNLSDVIGSIIVLLIIIFLGELGIIWKILILIDSSKKILSSFIKGLFLFILFSNFKKNYLFKFKEYFKTQ